MRGRVVEDDMRWLEAVMKFVWGTDQKCSMPEQLAEADRMLDDVEAKVHHLQVTLDERRAENLQEAMLQLTDRG